MWVVVAGVLVLFHMPYFRVHIVKIQRDSLDDDSHVFFYIVQRISTVIISGPSCSSTSVSIVGFPSWPIELYGPHIRI